MSHVSSVISAGVLLLIGGILANATAAPPSIGTLFPAGGKRGSEIDFTVTGKSDALPVTVSSDNKGLTITQDEKNKGTYHARISSDARLGPHLIWFRNSDGVAVPRIFVVGRHDEIAEKEPNNSHDKSQPIATLPATVNGKLEKSGDVDCYQLEIKQPCWLIASASAYGIDSPIDPLLHLRDSGGQRIAFANDGAHRLDPRLAWKIERPGSYTVEIAGFGHPPKSDIRFYGNASCVYRLTISSGPWIHSALPLAVSKSGTDLVLRGWNTPERKLSVAPVEMETTITYLDDASFENTFPLAVSDAPELIEESPRQHLTFPSAVTGVLSKAGEVDRYRYSTPKGRNLRFELHSAAQGFPVDAVLRIESSDGKELARADDADSKKRSGQDAALNWSAKEDGEYAVTVSDLLERGGERYLYRLVARERTPDFSASTATSSLVIEAGKSADLKISASRLNGYKGKLKIAFSQLPAGVKVEGGEISEKGGEVILKLSAEPDAKPHQSRMSLSISEVDAPSSKKKPVTISIKGTTTDAGDLLINETQGVWLTVKAPAKK